jgi:hypothetical protein
MYIASVLVDHTIFILQGKVKMTPEANPTTSIYNAIVVNFYNATGSLDSFEKILL